MFFLIFCLPLVLATTSDYRHKGLSQVPSGISSDTTILELNNNSIAAINSFPLLPSLRELDIGRNKLTDFPDVCTVSLTLTYLIVWNNELSTIESSRLSCLQNLEELYLGRNKLTTFPTITIPTLHLLDLTYNKLTHVPRIDIIAPLAEALHLSYNSIIASDLFTSLSQITSDISHFYLEGLNLESDNWNKLKLVVSELTMNTSQQILYLTSNQLSEMPDLSFVADSLNELGLTGNPIKHLDIEILRTYTALERFSCNYCMLTTLPNLCTLNNGLTQLFLLGNNPLYCDYRNEWMIAGIEAGILNLDNNPCAEPEVMTSIRAHKLNVNHFRTVKDKVHQTEVVSQSSDQFQCQSVLRVIKESDLSLVSCAAECVTSSDCLVFDYTTNHTRGHCRFLGVSREGSRELFENMFIFK